MPVDQLELESACRSLKLVLFGEHRSDLGHLGMGCSAIHVYVHAGRRAWQGKHVATWDGFDVIWHYKVGKAVAYVA